MKKNGDRRDWHKDCTLPATMKQFGAKSRLALAAAAAVLVAACSIGAVPGPKYVPESTTILDPEPQIPNLFVGCWRGTVDRLDTVTSFSPSVPTSSIQALSTTYQFCFTKRPDGTGQLDLTDVEIGGRKGKVTHFDNRVMSIDSDFHHGTMRNHATVESVYYILWIFPYRITQDIYADEDFQMISPDVIFVKGKQLVVIGNNMIASMTFHADFHRVQSSQLLTCRLR